MKARIAIRVARCKQRNLSPYPRALGGKGNPKQGFPNTNVAFRKADEENAKAEPAKPVGTPVFD